jgi:epoxyqueuosine reductase
VKSAELTAKVKELALANNLDYVGVAPAERLQSEPEQRRPDDYLPGARTVVSLGIRLSRGVELANRLAHGGGPRHAIYSYLWYGFGMPSLHYLDRTAFLITRMLEREGHIAVPVMAASPFDIQSNLMEFSNQHAAVAAGLGELGWSGLVMTPDVGPRARFSSIITTAPLESDAMYAGPKLCNVEECTKLGKGGPLCAEACATHAIGPGSMTVEVGGKSLRKGNFARFRCMWGSMGLLKETLGLKDIPMPEKDELDAGDVYEALGKRDASQILELIVIGRGDYCGKCIMACPVGRPEKVGELLARA